MKTQVEIITEAMPEQIVGAESAALWHIALATARIAEAVERIETRFDLVTERTSPKSLHVTTYAGDGGGE